ncbi:hypothetical protein N9L19_00855 [bacterium]|nr:hypothetical protein [bacterium]
MVHLVHEGAPGHNLEHSGSTPQTIRELATAIRSAKTNLTVPYGNHGERVLGVQGVLYMALLELQDAGFEYDGGFKKMLPFVYSHLHHTLIESRARRRIDANRKRVASPRDLALMLVESVKDVGTLDWFVRWCRPKTKQLVEWNADTVQFCGVEHNIALGVATEFFDFFKAQDLASALQDCDAQHIVSLAVHHSHCLLTRPKCIGVSENSQSIFKRGTYVRAAAVEPPSPPNFAVVAAGPRGAPGHATCIIEAPRVCQLCGRGFLNWQALFHHVQEANQSFAEYRNGIFYESESMGALPLPHSRNRTMLAKFAFPPYSFDSKWRGVR